MAPTTHVGCTRPVGSGKSALIGAMLGELHCDSGTVRVKGKVA